jgi:Major Facilitator Superfamily
LRPAPRHDRLIPLACAYALGFALRFSEGFWVIYLRSKGLSFGAVGWMETVFHVGALTGEVPTGWIADRFGRKVSLAAGRAMAIVAALLVLSATSALGVGVAFVFSALGYTCHSGAFEALLYDELAARERSADFTRLLGRMNVVSLVGCSVALLVGGLVAARSLEWLYLLNIAVDVATIAVVLALPERRRAGPRRRVDLLGDLRLVFSTLRQGRLAVLMAAWAFVQALAISFGFYGQSLMRERGVPLPVIGVVGTAAALLAIAPTLLAHRLEGRHGPVRPLQAVCVLTPLTLLAVALLPAEGRWVAAAGVVAALLAARALLEGGYPLFSSAMNALIPAERRATVLSAGSMVFSVTMMAIFPAIGLAGDRLGIAGGLGVLGAAGVAVGLLAAVTLGRVAATAPEALGPASGA